MILTESLEWHTRLEGVGDLDLRVVSLVIGELQSLASRSGHG